MLSNRITAKSLDEKPANQAKSNTVNIIKLFDPDGFAIEFSATFFPPIFHRERLKWTRLLFLPRQTTS